MIKVALVDDHLLFREGIRAILSADGTDLKFVAEAADARAAFPLLDDADPDVTLVDIALPGTSGIAVVREIRRRALRTKILMLTMHSNEDFVLQAFSAGADGYALKVQSGEELIEAIRAVAAGRRYLTPNISPSVLKALESMPAGVIEQGSLASLSAREREVFDMVIRNFSNREIGKHLCISVKTVETHRVAINRKLDCHSTAELVRLAAQRGLLLD